VKEIMAITKEKPVLLAVMKIKLLGLLPWMVIVAANAQDVSPAAVAFSHHEVTPRVAVRMNQECWIPVNETKKWGWKLNQIGIDGDLTIEGRKVRIPLWFRDGDYWLPLGETGRQIGANGTWDGDVFRIAGQIRQLQFKDSQLLVDGTLSFKTNAFLLQNPKRLVIDLKGLSLMDMEPAILPRGARIGPMPDNTVRIVIQDNLVNAPKTTRPMAARVLNLNLAPYVFNNNIGIDEPPFIPIPIELDIKPKPDKVTPVPTSKTVFLRVAKAEKIGKDTNLILSFDPIGPATPSIRYLDSTTVQIDMANTIVSDQVNDIKATDLVKSATWTHPTSSSTRLVVKLADPAVFKLSSTKGGMNFLFRRPKGADGKIAGKIIVIDPGHGGRDPGAQAIDKSLQEKNVVLEVGRRAADLLSDLGANVIMTRDTDVFVDLKERAAIANRSGADLFVSIHINSNRVANSRSGMITFHHKQEPEGKLLAQCLHDEIAKVSDIPNIGIWSDTRIYSSGFAVLRWTDMPSVLLELGFVNHSADRELMKRTSWRQSAALGIARGISRYFGNDKEIKAQP